MAAKKQANLGQTNKVKPVKGVKQAKAITDFALDIAIPRTPSDVAWYLVPWGKATRTATRTVGGITKKGAKAVSKVYRNMGK